MDQSKDLAPIGDRAVAAAASVAQASLIGAGCGALSSLQPKEPQGPEKLDESGSLEALKRETIEADFDSCNRLKGRNVGVVQTDAGLQREQVTMQIEREKGPTPLPACAGECAALAAARELRHGHEVPPLAEGTEPDEFVWIGLQSEGWTYDVYMEVEYTLRGD